MDFIPHGRYRISRQGQVVIIIPSGPHNLESFQAYIRDFNRISEEVGKNGPWALLIIAITDLVMSPEAEEAMSFHIRSVMEKGQVKNIAQSFEYLTGWKKLTMAQWERVSADLDDVVWNFYEDTREAIDWIESAGYPCKLSPEDIGFIEENRPVKPSF